MSLFQNQTGLAFPTSLSEKYRPQAIGIRWLGKTQENPCEVRGATISISMAIRRTVWCWQNIDGASALR